MLTNAISWFNSPNLTMWYCWMWRNTKIVEYEKCICAFYIGTQLQTKPFYIPIRNEQSYNDTKIQINTNKNSMYMDMY